MTSSYPAGGLGADELREAVRAVLREVLPAELVRGAAQGAAQGDAVPLEHVAVRDDGDLDALVRRVATLCEDPTRRAALRDGRHGFRLSGDRSAGPVSAGRRPPAAGPGIVRVDRGAVTERAVAQAAADGSRLVLGPRAVLTPLARDKARVLGVDIEKER